jgi:hypothetical protein
MRPEHATGPRPARARHSARQVTSVPRNARGAVPAFQLGGWCVYASMPNTTPKLMPLLPFPNPDVIARALPDGSVLFHPRTEVYFGLNETGTVVWDALRNGAASEDSLVDAIQSKWPGARRTQVLADVRELLADLSVEGLVLDQGEADTAA